MSADRESLVVERDQYGIRIVVCPDKHPHKRHGWVAANEDLRCPGKPEWPKRWSDPTYLGDGPWGA